MGATYTALPGWHSSCTTTARPPPPPCPPLAAMPLLPRRKAQEGAGGRRGCRGRPSSPGVRAAPLRIRSDSRGSSRTQPRSPSRRPGCVAKERRKMSPSAREQQLPSPSPAISEQVREQTGSGARGPACLPRQGCPTVVAHWPGARGTSQPTPRPGGDGGGRTVKELAGPACRRRGRSLQIHDRPAVIWRGAVVGSLAPSAAPAPAFAVRRVIHYSSLAPALPSLTSLFSYLELSFYFCPLAGGGRSRERKLA